MLQQIKVQMQPRIGFALIKFNAAMAQQVERVLGKDEVPGSNPGSSSNDLTHWSSMEYNVLHEGKNAETRPMGTK